MSRKVTKISGFAFFCAFFLLAAGPVLAENAPASQNVAAPAGASQDVFPEAMRIAAELRCPVCTGQSLAESNSEVAQEMRDKIVEMLRQGKTRQEVLDYFVNQYGDWILNSPPPRGAGLVAWLVPPAALAAGALVLAWYIRRRQPPHDAGGDSSPGPGTPPPPGSGPDRDAEIRRRVQDHLRDYL